MHRSAAKTFNYSNEIEHPHKYLQQATPKTKIKERARHFDRSECSLLNYKRPFSPSRFLFNVTPKQKGYIIDTRRSRHVQNENRGKGARVGRYGNVGQIYHPASDRPILLSHAPAAPRSKLA